MSRRLIFPLLLGLVGCAILLSLASWQVQRQDWKRQIIAEVEATIHADPVALPPQGAGARYLPVTVTGELGPERILVLVSRKQLGAGRRVIAPLEMADGRRVMVDLGFLPDGLPVPPIAGRVSLRGNIDMPAEVDAYTPAPDPGRDLWFARDVPAMAQALRTEPTFIAAAVDLLPSIEAMPITADAIPDNHMQYAFTWFLLAAVWAGMTGLLIWRIWQDKT